MPRGVYERTTGPGLRQMLAATPEGLCPFCLDPLQPKHTGRPGNLWRTCGDEVCRQAWWRTYSRDRRSYARGKTPFAFLDKAHSTQRLLAVVRINLSGVRPISLDAKRRGGRRLYKKGLLPHATPVAATSQTEDRQPQPEDPESGHPD